MGVYKPGYICWSSETIYNPKGKTYKEKYVYRNPHQVEDGMIIELVPIMGMDFPVLEHARFVNRVTSRVDSSKFTTMTLREFNIDYNAIQRRKKKNEKDNLIKLYFCDYHILHKCKCMEK